MAPRIIFGLALLLTNCSERANSLNSELQNETLFSSVYDTLDTIEVPVTFTPETWSEKYKIHIEKYGVVHDWDIFQHPFAKLTEGPNYKGIIFISTDETGSPILVTIDKKGQPIDTLSLLGDWGGNDPSIATTEIVTISEDFTIYLIDSTSTFDIGLDGDRIESSKKLEVNNELFKIVDSGKIVKIKSN